MGETTIEWTDFSVSPIRARSIATGKVFHFCERVSTGCKLCYAATMARRFGLPDYVKANRHLVEFFIDEQKLKDVLRRKKPTRFFWEDCSDLFGSWVPFEWIDRCFAVMALTPQHTHQVLTKRPERMAEYFADQERYRRVENAVLDWHRSQEPSAYRTSNRLPVHPLAVAEKLRYRQWWPLENVWLGTSCENQETADERIPHLLRTPAAVRFLSCEPLLGPIDLRTHFGLAENHDDLAGLLGWLIAGGESGHGARPMHPDWVRALRDQCVLAGVPFFFKQWGEWLPISQMANGQADGYHETLEPSPRYPEGQVTDLVRTTTLPYVEATGQQAHTLYRVGKKAAGRLLDGREWNEFPATASQQVS